ncbi:MAG TPA: PrsW family intramembrane metalloprotease [Streptosporangiaceae bacterium]
MSRLERRAVLAGRPSNRAPVPLLAGIVIGSVCAAIALILYARQPGLGGARATAIGIALALPTAAAIVAALLWVDRLEPEPRLNLLFAFLGGAGMATLLALVVNTVSRDYLVVPAFGVTEGTLISTVIGAPIVEETAKGGVLLMLLRLRRQEIDGPTDGIVYAAMVGVGFALSENVNYYMRGLHLGGTMLAYTVVLRGLIAPLCHPLFTSMTGLGVAYSAERRGGSRAAIVIGWLAAIVLHALWNTSSQFKLPGIAIVYALLLIVLLVLVGVLLHDRHRLVRLIARHVPAYAGNGLVTDDDVLMLSSLHGRRGARVWARLHGGMRSARAMGDYQLAATELALLHHRVETGTEGLREFDRRGAGLLRLMEDARDAFLRRQPRPQDPPWASRGSSGFSPVRGPVPPPGR